jgi:L-proline amide hydrolase
MSLSPSRKGTVPFGPYRTWYRVTGDLDASAPVLVVVHGGPGSTHDYLLGLADFAERGWPVVHYDQLGNGGSTHLPHESADFWSVQLFLDELANLLAALEIREYVLLGQSWGGLLAAEHAARRPSGLRGLIVANAPASYPLWRRELTVLRGQLPEGVNETLVRHEAVGTTDSAEYLAAMRVFYDRHVCRLRPWPQNLTASFMEIHNDPTVYRTMNGPSEFHVIGSLRDWSVVGRLPSIAVPTLLITGRHDEVTPASAQPYQNLVPDVRWEVFEESSHMPHLEEPQRFTEVVAAFLTGLPPQSTAPRPATVEHTR